MRSVSVLLVSSAAPMASPAAPDSLQPNKLQRREIEKSKQFLFCTEAVQKNKVSKPQRTSTVLEVLQRFAGSNTFCDLDPRCFGNLRVVYQAAKKKGGRNVKSKQVLFYTEAVQKNK